MKRIIAMLLALMLCLPLCACGGDAGDEVQYYKPGETVATDLVEFTLDEAEFAIALVNSSDRDTGLEKYFTPKEYDAEKDAKNPYVAAVGHTYAAITYTVNNLNRADTQIEGRRDFVTVTYNGEDYKAFCKTNQRNPSNHLSYRCIYCNSQHITSWGI